MKGKSLVILTFVAIVLVALAVVSNKRQSVRNKVVIGQKVLPSLAINDVQSISIEAPSATATVARIDGLWRVPSRYNYPADFEKIRTLLTKLAELKSLRTVRATQQQRQELHLAQAGAATADATPTVIALKDASGKPIEMLLLGKERMRAHGGVETSPYGSFPDGRFVATSKGSIHLVGDTLLDAAPNARSWMDEEFATLNADDILSIEVNGTTNGAISLARARGGEPFTLPSVPSGKETDSSKLARLTSALSYLRFEDVADPATPASATGLDRPVSFIAKTAKGVTCTLKIGHLPAAGSKYYAKVALTFSAPPASAAGGTNTVAAAQAEQTAKTAEDTARLSQKLSPWIYVIGEYEAEALVMGYADLLKDKPATEAVKPDATTK